MGRYYKKRYYEKKTPVGEGTIKKNRTVGKGTEQQVRKSLETLFERHGLSCIVSVMPNTFKIKQPIDIQSLGDVMLGVECKTKKGVWDGEVLSFLVKELSGGVSKETGNRQVIDQQIYLNKTKMIGLYCVATKLDESDRNWTYIFFPHETLYKACKNDIVRLNLMLPEIYIWKHRKDNYGLIEFIRNNADPKILNERRFNVKEK